MSIVTGSRRRLTLVAAFFLVTAPVLCQNNPSPEIPIHRWLQGNDRQDFPWRVRVKNAWLTFQQRHFSQIQIRIRVRDLLKSDVSLRDLHFIVKIAREDGRWFPGQSYSHFEPPENVASADVIDSLANVYVRPGNYKVAVMAYDSLNRKGNLWRGALRVENLKDDPLPEMDSHLPQIEFLPTLHPMSTGQGHGLESMVTFDPWALGEGELTLPVTNSRPVLVDVIANISMSTTTNTKHSEAPEWKYRMNAGMLLQISNVLSQLHLKNGCVRLTTLDLLRRKLFLDRQNADKVDWVELRHQLDVLNRNKIEASTLAGEKQTPEFLAKYLEALLTEPASCTPNTQPPMHVLIVVSDAFVFPNGAEMRKLTRMPFPETRCYYLKAVPLVGARWDEIQTLLKPLHPTRLEFADSIHFRKTVALLIEDMTKFSEAPSQSQ